MDEALNVMEHAPSTIVDDIEVVKPKAKRKPAPTKSKSATATKRLKGLLKVHGVSDAEIEEVVKKRAKTVTKKVKPNEIARRVKANKTAQGKAHLAKAVKVLAKGKASTVSARKVTGALTMKRSYQKEGKIATGTAIAGGARQTVCTFPEKLFGRIGARAKKEGTSFAEQIRRLATQALGAK